MPYLGQTIGPYMNKINPDTGMYYTFEQVSAQTGLSVDEVQAQVTAAQTANAIAVGAITVEDAKSMILQGQAALAEGQPEGFVPGYVEGLIQGLVDQGISLPPPMIEEPTAPSMTVATPQGVIISGPVNVNTLPSAAPVENVPITSGLPTQTVNVAVNPVAPAVESPAYYNKAGLPYTDEEEAYWFGTDNQWYVGEKTTGKITLLAGPPWETTNWLPIVAIAGIALLAVKGLFR